MQRTKNPAGSDTTRIAVMMPTWVGDACMATPTLRSLRAAFPAASITMISRPIVRSLIDGSWGDSAAWVDDFMLVTKRGCEASHNRYALTKACRAKKFDMAVLLTNSFWSAAAMRLAGVRRVVGYNRDARGWLLSDKIRVPHRAGKREPISAVDYYLAISEHIGAPATERSMELYVTEEEQRQANQLWLECGFSRDIPTLVINSNAATDPNRIWPQDRVRLLSKRVAHELGWQVLLHCGPKERAMANNIAEELDHPRVRSMGRWEELPIGLSKAVLQKAALVVTTDSGPRHMAIALERSVITLFGPTDPAWTITYNRPEIQLCGQGQAPSIADISVDEVYSAVRRYVDEKSGNGSAVAAA